MIIKFIVNIKISTRILFCYKNCQDHKIMQRKNALPSGVTLTHTSITAFFPKETSQAQRENTNLLQSRVHRFQATCSSKHGVAEWHTAIDDKWIEAEITHFSILLCYIRQQLPPQCEKSARKKTYQSIEASARAQLGCHRKKEQSRMENPIRQCTDLPHPPFLLSPPPPPSVLSLPPMLPVSLFLCPPSTSHPI